MEPVRGGRGGAGRRSPQPKLDGVGFGIGVGIGKGLREPCSPYREAYAFGAEIGTFDANDWNCYPEIVEGTLSFDLSSITPNHEVAIALSVFTMIYQQRTVWHRWYRARDDALLSQFGLVIPDPANYGWEWWEWYYFYAPIAWMAGEINENGDYYWKMFIDSTSRRLDFTIAGIPEPEPEFKNFALSEYSKV